MVNNQVKQFGTIFDAYGCILSYDSKDTSLAIMEAPKGHKSLIDKVLAEISHFDYTANYIDEMAALCIASYIDGLDNPLTQTSRLNILSALGIMKDGSYIAQVLMLQKNNRSWHYSDEANNCSHFGDECTHRGINPNPDRKGRRSTRLPKDYHVINGKGEINREQLVTGALSEMFHGIPQSNLISAKAEFGIDIDIVRAFRKLDVSKQIQIISDLQESVSA